MKKLSEFHRKNELFYEVDKLNDKENKLPDRQERLAISALFYMNHPARLIYRRYLTFYRQELELTDESIVETLKSSPEDTLKEFIKVLQEGILPAWKFNKMLRGMLAITEDDIREPQISEQL